MWHLCLRLRARESRLRPQQRFARRQLERRQRFRGERFQVTEKRRDYRLKVTCLFAPDIAMLGAKSEKIVHFLNLSSCIFQNIVVPLHS